MPRPPTGSGRTGVDGAAVALTVDDFAFLRGLEAAIDRALVNHREGESFVYGIHQELSRPVAEALEVRYRAAGWREVRVKRGETGAQTLVLVP